MTHLKQELIKNFKNDFERYGNFHKVPELLEIIIADSTTVKTCETSLKQYQYNIDFVINSPLDKRYYIKIEDNIYIHFSYNSKSYKYFFKKFIIKDNVYNLPQDIIPSQDIINAIPKHLLPDHLKNYLILQ